MYQLLLPDALPSDQRQKDPGEIVILLCDRPDEGKQQDHDDKAGQQFHDLDWQLVYIVIALLRIEMQTPYPE